MTLLNDTPPYFPPLTQADAEREERLVTASDQAVPSFRVLVTGSRAWRDMTRLSDALDRLLMMYDRLTVVHGACPDGADAMASRWCKLMNNATTIADPTRTLTVIEDPHPAKWNLHGKAAGPIRNREMVNLGADVCLAFVTPGCSGTVDCAAIAQRADIQVIPFFDTRP